MEDDAIAKDTEMSHLSTWMVVKDQPELASRLIPLAGKTSVPITVKLQCFGNEVELQLYSSKPLKSLLE